jgi:hypothetical protein
VEGSARGRVATKVQKKRKRKPRESEKNISRTMVRGVELVGLRPDFELLCERRFERSRIAARKAVKAEANR